LLFVGLIYFAIPRLSNGAHKEQANIATSLKTMQVSESRLGLPVELQ